MKLSQSRLFAQIPVQWEVKEAIKPLNQSVDDNLSSWPATGFCEKVIRRDHNWRLGVRGLHVPVPVRYGSRDTQPPHEMAR